MPEFPNRNIRNREGSRDEPSRAVTGMGSKPQPGRLTKAERDERDDRIIDFKVRHGLSVTEIAGLEGVHKSTVTRSLLRTHARWRADPLDIGATLRASLHRLQAISDHGMHEAFLEADRRTKVLCLRTAALAEGFTHRLLMMIGVINPDVLPTGHDPERADAAEIRRLAHEVDRLGVHALPPGPADLLSDAEREWIDGETVEADAAPVVAATHAPAPTFERAPDVTGQGRHATQRPHEPPAAGMIGGNGRHSDRDPRRAAMARVAPPGER